MFLEPGLEEREALLLNPLQLAYMGDSVWEMMVRTRLILQRKTVRHMHSACVESVNAGAQARSLKRILSELSETERSVVLRGRNTHARHGVPKHQAPEDYAEATGFEALLGFLYLTGNKDRLSQLERMILEIDAQEGAINARTEEIES